MSNELGMPIVAAVLAFVVGWMLAKIAGAFKKRDTALETPSEHHQIRSLEASLRVAQKKAHEMAEQFEATSCDFNSLKEAHEELESIFADKETKLTEAEKAVKDETAKVRDLRRELTTRAEAKIRAEAHAKEVETELSVMEAGSSAMKDEVSRLSEEHKDLTDKLHAATGSFESPLDESSDDDRNQSSEEFQPDC